MSFQFKQFNLHHNIVIQNRDVSGTKIIAYHDLQFDSWKPPDFKLWWNLGIPGCINFSNMNVRIPQCTVYFIVDWFQLLTMTTPWSVELTWNVKWMVRFELKKDFLLKNKKDSACYLEKNAMDFLRFHLTYILVHKSNFWDLKFGHKVGGWLMAAWQNQLGE